MTPQVHNPAVARKHGPLRSFQAMLHLK